jgi:hypothetical protein
MDSSSNLYSNEPGPYTIIYVIDNSENVELVAEEYKSLEAVNAFVKGRKLLLKDYVVVHGPKLTNTTEGK